MLYRKTNTEQADRNIVQLVLPETYRKLALVGCHNEIGHLAAEKNVGSLMR